jgi:hypothetical protein
VASVYKVPPETVIGFGATLLLAEDAVDVPLAFVAAIVNVYAWPATKVPVTVRGDVVPDVDKDIEGLLVTV